MSTPWKTDQWFTSNWNWLPEVRQDMHFPAKIRIHDVSLRDGEQQTGIAYNRADKVAIAKKLDEAGVHRIEAGMPAVSGEDTAADTTPPSLKGVFIVAISSSDTLSRIH